MPPRSKTGTLLYFGGDTTVRNWRKTKTRRMKYTNLTFPIPCSGSTATGGGGWGFIWRWSWADSFTRGHREFLHTKNDYIKTSEKLSLNSLGWFYTNFTSPIVNVYEIYDHIPFYQSACHEMHRNQNVSVTYPFTCCSTYNFNIISHIIYTIKIKYNCSKW